MGELDLYKLVFIDESGFWTNMNADDGWAPVGEAPIVLTPRRGQHISVIGAIAVDGVRVATELEGSFNGERFVAWLDSELGPTLREGDIVVMDGPRIHRVAGVQETLATYGATALYLPPYAPELNPIEMCWSWLKRLVRKWAPRRKEGLIQNIKRAWKELPVKMCEAWIKHSGYSVAAT
jgi:transposase